MDQIISYSKIKLVGCREACMPRKDHYIMFAHSINGKLLALRIIKVVFAVNLQSATVWLFRLLFIPIIYIPNQPHITIRIFIEADCYASAVK
jgi:hypothetical protein